MNTETTTTTETKPAIILWSKAQIIAHNERHNGHFFDKSTIRFFRSRFHDAHIATGPAGTYFVTSEQFDRDNSPRLYTLRRVTHDGIDTIGDFQAYRTAATAMKAARAAAKAPTND